LHPGDAAGASPFAAAHGAICRALGVSIAPDDLCQRWALAWEPDPAMLAIVDRVRSRCRTAVLTDNGPVLLEAMPRVFPELTRRFDWLVFSCELGATKPGPAAFERALARVGCSPPAALLVDDLPANVDGARAAGLHAHRYTTLGRLVQALAEAGVLETGTTLPTG
jgi:putative hydrolase of the HAD superfamily